MRNERYIAFFLIFISIAMLMVPVIPHHHHDDGLICMKDDITSDCCEQHHDAECEHCCCDTGCVTTHFFQQTPTAANGETHPDFPIIITLFSESILKILLLPERDIPKREYIYLESLHGTYLTRATGLRAPPSVLA